MIAEKAAFVGAKMVTFASESTVPARPADTSASTRELKPRADAVFDALCGSARTVSIICATPPVNFAS